MTNRLTLRDVDEGDLVIFFQQQLSPEANFMAAFTAKDPTDEKAFLDRWQKILADKTVYAQTIMVGEDVVGNISHHSWFGEPELTYWIDQSFWGKGVATEAVRQFLEKADTRPLYARAAEDNFGSRRVLEKSGFVYSGKETGFAEARGHDIKEIIYVLHSDETNQLMTTSPFQTIRPSRFSTAQRQALDAIGHALKRRKIDFHTAAELSDLVRAGRLDEALMHLKHTPDN